MDDSKKKLLIPLLLVLILGGIGYAVYSATKSSSGIVEEAVPYTKKPPPDSAPVNPGGAGSESTEGKL